MIVLKTFVGGRICSNSSEIMNASGPLKLPSLMFLVLNKKDTKAGNIVS